MMKFESLSKDPSRVPESDKEDLYTYDEVTDVDETGTRYQSLYTRYN